MLNKKIYLFSSLLILITHLSSFGQIHLTYYDSIDVIVDGNTIQNPWAGGFNSPQFSEIDINNDGLMDIFAFERDYYGTIKCFINQGDNNLNSFVLNSNYDHLFPEMNNWAIMADYNCDGKQDIFTSVPAGIAVYRNDSEETLKFTRVSNLLQSSVDDVPKFLYAGVPDIPAISDIDMDGDLDILSFGVLGETVFYHKNMSMEKYGNCDALEFELITECWGYFSENSQDNSIILFDSCNNENSISHMNPRHAGSALLAIDLNNDMLKDLLLGDISYSNIVMLTNGGSLNEAQMINTDDSFPSYDTPTDLRVFPASYHIDINNDNKKDLIVSPNNPNTSENYNNIWLYENTSTNGSNTFEFRKNSFLQDEMIDVGEGARAVFFDADNDGLMDIVIGNYGYFIESANYESKLMLMLNKGSISTPKFELTDNDYMQVSTIGFDGIYPCFEDMDGDGDKDMLCGDAEGRLHYFTNIALPGETADFLLSKPNYMDIDVGQAAIPQIFDVNMDGKADIIVGEKSGTIKYFENIGSLTEAEFNAIPTNNKFGGIDVTEECCSGYSAPYITTDSLGLLMLYLTSESGMLYQYSKITNNIDGVFDLTDSLFLNKLRPNIWGGDIDNDGKEEFVIGEYAGGISIMKRGIPQWLNIKEKNRGNIEFVIFPNPAKNKITIEFPDGYNPIEIKLVDQMGSYRTYNFSKISKNSMVIDISSLASGLYFVSVNFGSTISTKKLIISP